MRQHPDQPSTMTRPTPRHAMASLLALGGFGASFSVAIVCQAFGSDATVWWSLACVAAGIAGYLGGPSR